jgi:hypothetical protein
MMTDILLKYWPAGAIVLAFLFLLARIGFIDGVVHVSAFEAFKMRNAVEHRELEIKIEKVGEGHTAIMESLGRIEQQTKK